MIASATKSIELQQEEFITSTSIIKLHILIAFLILHYQIRKISLSLFLKAAMFLLDSSVQHLNVLANNKGKTLS